MKINNKLLLTKIAPVTLAAVAVVAAVSPDGRNGHSHLSFDTGRLTPSSEHHSGLRPHEYTLGEGAGERPRDFEGVLEDIGVDAKAGSETVKAGNALKQDEGTRLYLNYKNLGHSVAALRSFWALSDLLWTPLTEVDVGGSFTKGALRAKEQNNGGLAKEAHSTKQPSALANEGDLPKDEAHDEAACTPEIVRNDKSAFSSAQDDESGSSAVTPKAQSRVLPQELDTNESWMDEQGSTLGGKEAEDAVEGQVEDDGGGGADATMSSMLRHADDGVPSFVAALLVVALLALLVPKRDVLVSYRNTPRVVSRKKLFSFRTTAILCCALASATVSLAGDATAPLLGNRPAVSQDLGPHLHLRGRSEHLDLSASDKELVLSSFTQDVSDLFSEIELLADEDLANAPYVLKASADLLSLLNDRLSDPQLIPSLPNQFKPLFKNIADQVSKAEAHVMTIEQVVSKHSSGYMPKGVATHRWLTSGRKLAANPTSRLSRADYYSRAKSGRWQNPHHLGFASLAGDQQGYFRARAPRQEGTHRRLSEGSGISCIRDDRDQRKTDQCLRLASCARNYNIYDLFVFMFADDIDFETGLVDDEERIQAADEVALFAKLERIKQRSKDILELYDEDGTLSDASILQKGELCDQLLQEFHRFDEDLSVNGKWQGGSVTAVCRGWGTNKFMSLEAIYHISGETQRSRPAEVEECLKGLVDQFDQELENFAISEPCDVELTNPDGTDAIFARATKAQVMADIKKKFDCLKYSYLVYYGGTNATTGDCPDYECEPDACKEMQFEPVFRAKDTEGVGFPDEDGDAPPNAPPKPYFEYDFSPVVLPSRAERRSKENENGHFLIDHAGFFTLRQGFIVEVFSEYMGCAHDIVEKLEEKIFGANNIRNPYSPHDVARFELPMKIKETSKDTHGQLNVTYLDEVFAYLKIPSDQIAENYGLDISAIIDAAADPPKLSRAFKDYLSGEYSWEDDVDHYIEVCSDDDEDNDEYCSVDWVKVKDGILNQGESKGNLDISIALIFGNKTTIGQVCSYAKGLEDGIVDDVPGFCCLDAPYESDDWGENFACTKYANLTSGATTVVQKNASDCNRLGPITAAFNEAACDIFHGTWCPTPRSCQVLVNCVRNMTAEALESRTRPAFYEYLDAAPLVEDARDPVTCGQLRQYFEYDADYADDYRICEEVRDLQCHTDFTNLDAFASGTAGSNGEGGVGLPKLAVKEDLIEISKAPFPPIAAKFWRNGNFALELSKVIIEHFGAITETLGMICEGVPEELGAKASCVSGFMTVLLVANGFVAALDIFITISEHIYAEIADAQDGDYEDDRQQSIYENIVTNHGNIIQAFRSSEQVKVMLGEISDGIADLGAELEDQGGGRRLATSTCVNVTDVGYQIGCDKVTCEDPTMICDGSYNYPYIALLQGAGCDDLDSDGDGVPDVCEDRFPPETVMRDAEIFRCDEDDTSRLCYGQKVFKNETHLMNFLEYHFPVTDDCQPTRMLSAIIEYVDGECRDTVYNITPMQNVSACEGVTVKPGNLSEIEFKNPLYGKAKEVAVAFDSQAPVVQCGFRQPGTASIDKLSGNETTLYHYMLKKDDSGNELNDAGFFFNVTDNCNDDVQINIGVKSNELQQDAVAELFKYNADPVPQVEFLYSPTTCGNIVEAKLCRENPSNVRFYEIDVAAIDSAGNIGRDTCKVVVVSTCSPASDVCEKLKSSGDPTAETFYYTMAHVDNATAADQVLYEVASTELVWERA